MPGDKDLYKFLNNQVKQIEDVDGMLAGKDKETNNTIDRLTGADKREAMDTANTIFLSQYGDKFNDYAEKNGIDLEKVNAETFKATVLASGVPEEEYNKWVANTDGL